MHGNSTGADERLITLNVNGQQRRVDVMRQETLTWTLRYKLGLTGTKLGCDRAECGACTVLLGDAPSNPVNEREYGPREQFVDGIENAPKALIGILCGENTGKQLVRVAAE